MSPSNWHRSCASLFALLLLCEVGAADVRKKPQEKDLKPGLRASIYDDYTFQHKVKGRVDDTIDFDFGSAGPDPDVKGKKYSIRWAGWLKVPESDDYTLGFSVNGNVKFYLDDKLEIAFGSSPKDHGSQRKLNLTEGLHHLRVEFFSRHGAGHIHFHWSRGKEKSKVVPGDALFHEVSGSES